MLGMSLWGSSVCSANNTTIILIHTLLRKDSREKLCLSQNSIKIVLSRTVAQHIFDMLYARISDYKFKSKYCNWLKFLRKKKDMWNDFASYLCWLVFAGHCLSVCVWCCPVRQLQSQSCYCCWQLWSGCSESWWTSWLSCLASSRLWPEPFCGWSGRSAWPREGVGWMTRTLRLASDCWLVVAGM